MSMGPHGVAKGLRTSRTMSRNLLTGAMKRWATLVPATKRFPKASLQQIRRQGEECSALERPIANKV